MNCTVCDERLVSAYIRAEVGKKKNKGHKKIGLFCKKCKTLTDYTKFLIQKELEVKNKKLANKKHRGFVKYREICSECRSTNLHIRKISESVHVYYDGGRKEWLVQRRTPQNACKCLKCENKWTSSREEPTNPKYIVPPQTKKEHLKLIMMKVPLYQLKIPKNKLKIRNQILEEFKKEQEEKRIRDSKK